MPTCSAKDCRNSSRHNAKFCSFPRDTVRRAKWLQNAGLQSIKDGAALCEYHFTMDMWEKERVDGKRKLKANAVPVIFGDFVMQRKKIENNVATPGTSSFFSDIERNGQPENTPMVTSIDPTTKVVTLQQLEVGHKGGDVETRGNYEEEGNDGGNEMNGDDVEYICRDRRNSYTLSHSDNGHGNHVCSSDSLHVSDVNVPDNM